jgi:formylmethanofuran dehydrogenase subunit E
MYTTLRRILKGENISDIFEVLIPKHHSATNCGNCQRKLSAGSGYLFGGKMLCKGCYKDARYKKPVAASG